ncbi:hypothetical protein B0I35DRAFT_499483 [Stachybotrys elegans]|uniref:F-box domain-containing protein n=1 Tax=Stachybotrys elegans TaxID=80388 RepID=A0A8K0SZB5_9HYPO|nr:hypothetical protein B0I35DRAFT_499483 [Stachybotrys elegans]
MEIMEIDEDCQETGQMEISAGLTPVSGALIAHPSASSLSGENVSSTPGNSQSSGLTLLSMPMEIHAEIHKYIDDKSLAALCRTCQHLKDAATRSLYLRDARHGGRAIHWASKKKLYSLTNGGYLMKTVMTAKSYDAKVNAIVHHGAPDGANDGEAGYSTALHMAAALCGANTKLLHWLLNNKADTTALGFKLERVPEIEQTDFLERCNTLLWRCVCPNLDEYQVLPSFIPCVLSLEHVIDVLQSHGAPQQIMQYPGPDHRQVVTRLHAATLWGTPELMKRLIDVYGDDVDGMADATPHRLCMTPVHLAIQLYGLTEDLSKVSLLVSRGANVWATRKKHHRLIIGMAQAGADLNRSCDTGRVPLNTVIVLLGIGWGSTMVHIQQLMEDLLREGASPNVADNEGLTAIQHLVLRIANHPGEKYQLLKLFTSIMKHNADLNTPLPDGHSLMYRVITNLDEDDGQGQLLFKRMCDHNARILNHEAEDILHFWATISLVRVKYDIAAHKDHISSRALRQQYELAARESDRVVFHELQEYFGNVPIFDAEFVVQNILNTPEHAFMLSELKDFDFNPNFCHAVLGTFFDMIVDKMKKGNRKYTEKHAIQDARVLLKRGGSLVKAEFKSKYGSLSRLLEKSTESKEFKEFIFVILTKKNAQARHIILDYADCKKRTIEAEAKAEESIDEKQQLMNQISDLKLENQMLKDMFKMNLGKTPPASKKHALLTSVSRLNQFA